MSFVDLATAKRIATSVDEEVPKQRKRSRTGGSKDLYDGHSQDVMLAKTLIDPDHQCSVTTVKAYVTHVCAWFRYCRTLPQPDYTCVNEQKLSGFLTWATQTPRLPCKTGGAGGSMSYQSARRYVEGGILALWRRYRRSDEENPLHALSYLNTKYAIREATASERPRMAERQFSAMAIAPEQEDAIVKELLGAEVDMSSSIKAWAYYVLGAATWIPGTRVLHLRLDTLAMALRTDARLVEHTTVPFLEFRVNPDPAAPTSRYAEVSAARNVNPLVCPWFAVASLVFAQWQAAPSALALAATTDPVAWLAQPLFQAATGESRVLLPDDARVQMVLDEISPLLTQATSRVRAAPESHVIRRRDKQMAETLGLSAPQVVRLEKWRVHHRRTGVTRQQTFFDLTLVLAGHMPPPPQATGHVLRMPQRTRLQVPEHLASMVFPWLGSEPTTKPAKPQFSRHRSHSVSAAAHSEDVVRAERNASRRLMRELATVLLQDVAALLADSRTAHVISQHPLFHMPLFTTRAFREFAAYAAQALSLQHEPSSLAPAGAAPPPVPVRPTFISRPRRHTFETIREEDPVALAQAAAMAPPPVPPHPSHSALPVGFNPMLLSQPLPFPPHLAHPQTHAPQLSAAVAAATAAVQPAIAFPQLAEEPAADGSTLQHPQSQPQSHNQTPSDPMSQQYLMQIMDYLSAYNQSSHVQQQHHQHHQAQTQTQERSTTLATSFTAQFPRLTSESCSGESTASPELPSNLPISSQTLVSAHHSAAPTYAYAYSQPLYSRPITHHHSFTAPHAPTQLMLPTDTASAAAAAAAAATAMAMASINATPHSNAQLEPLPLAQHHSAHNLSMYFANASAANGGSQEFIDPSALATASSVTPPHIVGLPKSRSLLQQHHHHHNSASMTSSLSPTPTPSSDNSPSALLRSGFNSSAQILPGSDPSSALQFSIAPHKLQFKADHELLM
ncbi:hypothetical protein J3B02_003816 [Coemansia erecta]|uniref:Ndc10 domain-containing protein n=1 Tax=Coemansia asiatica TaxID=1052880 RepID=A0A9W8CHG2_9FUNG|nr:hypothetical protein LPJ64_006161 [Coemansia asiatica]KAJ2849275.1 hypothetical protein J3B02_003816 [Coemansia erecta]KAJ2878318.1 hypothetical protein FB639_003422 [Coemansia asiatica]